MGEIEKKYTDEFFEWCKKQKHRYLLLLIPLAFLFLKYYFDLSFKLTIQNWRFLSITGLVLLITGIFEWRESNKPDTDANKVVGVPIIIFGFIILVSTIYFNFDLIYPISLPKDKLVVGIARFTPVSENATNEANNFPHRIEVALNEMNKDGAPIETKRIGKAVEGENWSQRQYEADKLGGTKKGLAHIILWGEIRTEKGELFIKPYVTIANQLRDSEIKEKNIDSVIIYDCNDIELKEKAAKDIADIINLLYAMAYYKIGKWEKAIEILSNLDTEIGKLYWAKCYIEKAKESDSPIDDLSIADRILTELKNDLQSEHDVGIGSITWKVDLAIADTYLFRGNYSSHDKATDYFDKAIELYERKFN